MNAGIPERFLRQFQHFIKQILSLQVDIYNISLSGSLLQANKKNVMESYIGKSIIVPSNRFTYFGSPERFTYEFMDPRLVTRLAKLGTTFMFLGVHNLNAFGPDWSQLLALPPVTTSTAESHKSLQGLQKKPFLRTLEMINCQVSSQKGFETQFVTIKKKGLFKSTQKTIHSEAKKLASKLALRYPLQNYYTMEPLSDGAGNIPLGVTVLEGLPMSSRIWISQGSFDSLPDSLPVDMQYWLMASLPFKQRTEMLWTFASSYDTAVVAQKVRDARL
jgi:hypothetical protein